MLRVVDVVAKTTVQQSARMLVAEIPGEIQIGALFPVHRQIAGSESCGQIWEQYGIQRTEIALRTVRELQDQLPFRLGISVRDSCWTERIAMEQTIAFLREGVAQCSCCQTPGCNKKSVPVVAIVGPGKSSATIAVQNLLQAQAINRLLHHYNWTYIAVLYSAGNYGEKGFEALERLLSQKNSAVCVAYSQKIKSLAGEAEYRNVLKSLASQKSRPQVVVCFCEGLTVRNFFQAQKHLITRNKNFKRFQWIGSDSWADRNDVVNGLEDEAEGSFSIRIHAPKVPGFREYYSRLNPENNTMNPWFREFWQQKFGCQFAVSKEDKNNENIRICTGNEDLDREYKEDPKLSQVINSISVVAFGLKAMYQDRCRDNSTLCTEMLSRNGTLLYQYLLNVTFEDQFKQSIYFDSNGDPPAWYDILNYVGKRSPDEPYAEVGSFQSNNINGVEELNMTDTHNIVFFDHSSNLPSSSLVGLGGQESVSSNYGEKGFEALERLLSQKNSAVCVAYSQKIKSLAGEAEYRNVLKSLASQKSRPQVVVCFCEGLTVRNFFQAQKHLITRNKNFKRVWFLQRFQWIGSDSWADRNDVVNGLEDEAEGSFSIRIHAPKVPGFREYYSRLNPENNTMNPWFREFWQQKFGCQFAVSKEDKNNENIRICTGNEDLDREYKEDPKLSQVINSISVVAFGLKAMYQDRCRDNSTLCTEMLSRNGTLLYQYLLNVTFEDQFKQSIYFDSNGDPPAWYDILNYVGKRSPDEPYAEVVITWILVGIQCVIVAVGVLQEWPSAGFSPHYLPSRMRASAQFVNELIPE
ncbi:ligand-binding protein, receptor family [Teladorsagia circumcincta]|uniref:Ligand-binding protein, receptor family n=1 Tax=Teladorsagia circumcincta TaxID=45464 RepID=A0A2G9ULQ8_TELCI|nr:ligand-binding protein, receptor family [Teladorsagia circumcincta]